MTPAARRIVVIGFSAALSLVLAAILIASFNPLRRPEAEIRSHLLSEVPLGSSIAQVQSQIQLHGWTLSYPLADTGFVDQRTKPNREVGVKHFRAILGDYRDIPWKANVTAFWGFNDTGKLMDLWIWKTWDGL